MKKQKTTSQNFLSKNYPLCFKFLRQIKKHILFSVAVFLLFALIGFIFPIFFREQIIELIRELTEKIAGFNVFELLCFIFFNNLKASFLAIILGFFLGLYPLFTLIANGYLLGFVINQAVKEQGILILWRLLPHGIFELPAIFVSVGLGLKIGLNIFKKHSWKLMKKDFRESLRCFIFIVLPLLIVAAIIEGILVFCLG